jgi:hypothetical protein
LNLYILLNLPEDSILYLENDLNITKEENTKMEYQATLSVPHDMTVKNITTNYTIALTYFKSNNTNPIPLSIPFNWTVMTMDLNPAIYLVIVMIGVLISRMITLLIKKIGKATDNLRQKLVNAGVDDLATLEELMNSILPKVDPKDLVSIKPSDSLWLLFSFVIAVLIFGVFKDKVDLGSSILVNIALAFGFGFAFEKVLEVATQFHDLT